MVLAATSHSIAYISDVKFGRCIPIFALAPFNQEIRQFTPGVISQSAGGREQGVISVSQSASGREQRVPFDFITVRSAEAPELSVTS